MQVFISHTQADSVIASRIASDLENAGAQVWIDSSNVHSGDFMKAINNALSHSDWIVLVQTPESLSSNYVQLEINAAFIMYLQKRIKGIIPFIVKKCRPKSIPSTWQVLHKIDAVQDYSLAFSHLCIALGLDVSIPHSTHSEEQRIKPKIIVIDDDEGLCELISAVLVDQGYETIIALDGIKGLTSIFSNKPDCIIIDYTMPGLNGYEVIKALREDPITSTIPIVLMTARAGFGTTQSKFLYSHVQKVLFKGFALEEFLQTINSIVKNQLKTPDLYTI